MNINKDWVIFHQVIVAHFAIRQEQQVSSSYQYNDDGEKHYGKVKCFFF